MARFLLVCTGGRTLDSDEPVGVETSYSVEGHNFHLGSSHRHMFCLSLNQKTWCYSRFNYFTCLQLITESVKGQVINYLLPISLYKLNKIYFFIKI